MADGLRGAMWIGGAASAVGGLLAFSLRKPPTAAGPDAIGTHAGEDARSVSL